MNRSHLNELRNTKKYLSTEIRGRYLRDAQYEQLLPDHIYIYD
jgi:hypothetical protein